MYFPLTFIALFSSVIAVPLPQDEITDFEEYSLDPSIDVSTALYLKNMRLIPLFGSSTAKYTELSIPVSRLHQTSISIQLIMSWRATRSPGLLDATITASGLLSAAPEY